MDWVLVALGFLVLVVAVGLVRKLLKLAFSAAFLFVLLAAIWYFSQ